MERKKFIGPIPENGLDRKEEKLFNLQKYIQKLDSETTSIIKKEDPNITIDFDKWNEYVKTIKKFIDIEENEIEKDENGKIQALIRFINFIEKEDLEKTDLEKILNEIPNFFKV